MNRLSEGDIGIKITGKVTKTVENSGMTSSSVGFIEKVKDGVVNLEFWAKEPGTYTITPYVKGKANSEGKSITVEVLHDYTVNLAVFKPTGKGDYVGTNTLGAPEGESWIDINFYHKYDENNIIPVTVRANKIRYERLNNTDKTWVIKSVVEGNNGYIAVPDTSDEAVKKLQIAIGEDVPIGTELKFNILDTSETENKVLKTITVFVSSAETSNSVKVGTGTETQWMTVYQEPPAGSSIVHEDDEGILYTINGTKIYYEKATKMYYTLTSIRKEGDEVTDTIVNKYINTANRNKDKENNVSFIDKDNTTSLSRNTVKLAGFTENSQGIISKATGTDDVNYVGIGIGEADMEKLEQNAEQIGEQLVIMYVDMYYTPEGANSAHWEQRIYITK
ncbi:MAG: hypothetical protein HFJ50_08695 [Clostridia bacterium]|nr:hypothetical protein [Clostridia bacterium]